MSRDSKCNSRMAAPAALGLTTWSQQSVAIQATTKLRQSYGSVSQYHIYDPAGDDGVCQAPPGQPAWRGVHRRGHHPRAGGLVRNVDCSCAISVHGRPLLMRLCLVGRLRRASPCAGPASSTQTCRCWPSSSPCCLRRGQNESTGSSQVLAAHTCKRLCAAPLPHHDRHRHRGAHEHACQ